MATRFIAYVPKPTEEKNINNQSTKKNLLPSRVSTIESDPLIHNDNRTMIKESLPVIYRSSNNGDKDNDMYFPTVQDLIAKQGMSREHTPKGVDKPALDDDDCSINPEKYMSGPNLGNSQDKPIFIGEGEQADLSDFYISSTDSDSNDSESNDGSVSSFDRRPAHKKQKTDNSQYSRRGCSTSVFQTARTVQDELLADNDTNSECTWGWQDPFGGQDPYDEAIKLLTAVCDSELEDYNSMDSRPKEDTNITSTPQPAKTAISKESAIAVDGQPASPLAIPASDDPEMPQQVVEVADEKQEWEICGIIDDKDVDGVLHYWVQWSPTLVSESEMGKASALVAKYKARLRAQRKQKGRKGRGRLLLSKAGKQAAVGIRAACQKQEKKQYSRPRKQTTRFGQLGVDT